MEKMVNEITKKGLFLKIIICSGLFICVGIINSLWTNLDYKGWYQPLSKPFYSPPSSALVGMIWTIMYILMGISVGKIWQIAKHSSDIVLVGRAKRGIRLFFVQIIVNMIVPIFFFAMNNLYLLLIAVIVNFVLLLIIINHFHKINKSASYILIPYSIWLFYAVLLDGGILILN